GRRGDTGLHALDQRDDLLRGAGRVFSELAHFGGYDGKTPAVFAGTGRFDRGVEGQEVGVVCDLLDDADDFADAQRMLSELLSPLCGLGDRVPDLLHGCDGGSYSLSTGTGIGDGSLS